LPASQRIERLLLWGAAAVCTLVAASAVAYGILTAPTRLYEGVEGELAFEASRLRAGLPLYVDPLVGAFDYGKVPARFYALYTPVWSLLVSLASPEIAKPFARLISFSAWLGTLALAALAAPPERKRTAWTFAAFAAGCFFLVRGAVSGTGDTLATLLATGVLLRVTRRNGPTPLDAGLLALAPLVKPNVIGILIGVLFVEVRRAISDPRARRVCGASVGAAGLTLLVGSLVFEMASGGAWLRHLVLSSAQEPRLGRWVDQFGTRLVLLGAPHAAIAVAAWMRGKASPYALGALVASAAWATLSMAKGGSATNYWLEPTAAALVVISTTEGRAFERLAAWTCGGFGVLSAAISGPALSRIWLDASAAARALPALSVACPLAPGEMLASNDMGIEVELTGRLTIPPFQMTYLLRHARFPLSTWRNDLALSELRYFVTRSEYFEAPPPEDEEGKKERYAFLVELRDSFDQLFAFERQVGPFRVYRKR
jgi:hypothetical protein